MAERMYFFDSTEDDERIYSAADFARFHHNIIGNGVSNTENLPDLEVSEESNMDVSLGAGYMFTNGYMYENTSTMMLTHDVADADNDRIDRVVIRFDSNPEERTIKAMIKKGTPSSNPNPPSLTRDEYVHEMSVAQVRIIAGKSFIEEDEITDERADDDVCGYIPLHNIYRGLEVDELGRLAFPKQTHVVAYTEEAQEIDGFEPGSGTDDVKINLPVVDKDTQKEYHSSESQFESKSDGVILVNAHLDLMYDEDEYRVSLIVYRNDEKYQEIGYIAGRDTAFRAVGVTGTSLIPVSKGDVLDLRIYTRRDLTIRGRGLKYGRIDYFKIA